MKRMNAIVQVIITIIIKTTSTDKKNGISHVYLWK